MNNVKFTGLLRWDLHQALRSRLLWFIVAIMAAAFVWGAQNSARMHAAQAQALSNALRYEQQWLTDLRNRAEQYRVQAPTPLPYWQDPTDVAGFSQYFLFKHSLKPHLPSSPLAIGVSDLLPPRLQVKLSTPFGVDASYDFQNPRSLVLGQFDLAFAVVYLLPVALILLFGLMTTYERDRGVLRLVAAQAVSPRVWLMARVAAITVVVLPSLLLAVVVALVLAGVPLQQTAPEILAALAVIGVYALFWIAVTGVVLSRWPRGSGAISVLVTIWAVLVIGMPLLINSAVSLLKPATMAAEYVDAQRRIDDELQEARDDLVRAAFLATPSLSTQLDKVATIDHATRLSFLAPEIERRLSQLRAEADSVRNAQARTSAWAAFVTPPLGVEDALMRLAGTDLARHRSFEHQTRDYQLELRRIFYPLMQAQIISPTPRPPQSYGRFNFTQYEIIPPFRMMDDASGARVAGVMPVLAWFSLLSIGLGWWATRRLTQWPADL
jgi:ABC-2 type transport system permease protein